MEIAFFAEERTHQAQEKEWEEESGEWEKDKEKEKEREGGDVAEGSSDGLMLPLESVDHQLTWFLEGYEGRKKTILFPSI